MPLQRIEVLQIAALAILAVALAALGIWIALRVKNNPEKRERQRRKLLGERGRFGDAVISEVGDGLIYYSYSVQGVHYAASQDVSTLTGYLPAHSDRLIGPSSIKYASNNPGNSILLCEEWSGLRVLARASEAELLGDDAIGHQA